MIQSLRNSAELVADGDISAYADWNEDFYIFDPLTGGGMDLTGLGIYYQFRRAICQTTADVVVSTANGMISIVADANAVNSIARVSVPRGTFANYIGNMILDVAFVDQSDDVLHYAHGVVTITNTPATI